MSDDWQVVEEALTFQEENSEIGPLFPEALDSLARLREHEAQQKEVTQKWYDEAHDKRRRVARLEEALRLIIIDPLGNHGARAVAKKALGIPHIPFESHADLARRALAHKEEK